MQVSANIGECTYVHCGCTCVQTLLHVRKLYTRMCKDARSARTCKGARMGTYVHTEFYVHHKSLVIKSAKSRTCTYVKIDYVHVRANYKFARTCTYVNFSDFGPHVLKIRPRAENKLHVQIRAKTACHPIG